MSGDPMEVDAALTELNTSLRLQYRSALQLTVAAGSMRGVQWQPFGPLLWSFAEHELDDTRRLIEKIVALGGTPDTDVPAFKAESDPEATVRSVIDHECEA